MNRLTLLFYFLFGLNLYCFAQKDWHLAKKADMIEVYVRDVPGTKLKELKTIALFESSPDALLALLTDIPAQSAYQFGCLSSARIGKSTIYEQIFYQQLYMPWPFSQRDGVFKQVINPLSTRKEIFIETISMSELIPHKTGYVRVPFMQSGWHIKRVSDSIINAEYKLKVDPGGAIPKWLINLFIDKGPYESILNLRRLLKEKKYKNAYINWLH